VKTPPQKNRPLRADKITEPLPSDDPFEFIRRRAYEIWEGSGRPHGQHLEHWRQAELEWSARAAEPRAAKPNRAAKPQAKRSTPKDR